jgi:deoxyxylulose-5-phosphate synthase
VVRGSALVVSLENGLVCGGFGESIGADLRFGWPDVAVAHGTVDELEREHGFDAASVAESVLKRLR